MTNRLLLLLFLLPSLAQAQSITYGDAIPAQAVDAAQKTIDAAKPKMLALNPGEFEIIEPAKGVAASLLWLSTDPSTMQRLEIPAGQAFSIYGIRRGDKVAKHHVFQARAFAWSVVIGATQGHNVLTLVKSGDKPELAPVVVDTIDVTVGKPKPVVPDVPVDDALTQALRVAANADYKAGKSDKKILLPLAGIYEAAANDTLATVTTVGALDDRLYQARLAAGIPEPEVAYPTMRKAIQTEIYSKVGVDNNSASKPLTDAMKKSANAVFSRVAASLEAIAQ